MRHAEWWDSAKVDDIALAHETATVWRNYDDVARDAGDTIRQEVQARYGIDADAPGGDPAAVAAALREAEQARADARVERERAGEELAASQILFANADRREREAQQSAEYLEPNGDEERQNERMGESTSFEGTNGDLAYDSAERRQRLAASFEGKADQKTIDARILADDENAKHPREAVMTAPGKAAKPRRNAQSAVQQRERGGLGR